MSSSSTMLTDVDLQPGGVPMLQADALGDGRNWAAAHRDALRGVVAEHGVVLVRGLGLRDTAEVGAVFGALAVTGLMVEQEAFAERQTYAEGIYSSTKWPPNQPMCMHHELSYRLEFPGLMQFACLSAPTKGGRSAWRTRPPCSTRCPGHSANGFGGEAGCSSATTKRGTGGRGRGGSAPREGA